MSGRSAASYCSRLTVFAPASSVDTHRLTANGAAVSLRMSPTISAHPPGRLALRAERAESARVGDGRGETRRREAASEWSLHDRIAKSRGG